jgi:3-phenylpropionate/cinnamic acid dioxygenase small subunit
MMDERNALFSQQTFARAVEFIWREAEMLDRRDYRAWLDLWDTQGFYVVPIDPSTTDYAASLNYAYDDQDMREKRVQRMTSGYSASAPMPRAPCAPCRASRLKALPRKWSK